MKATIYPLADAKTQWFAGAYPGSIMSLAAPVLCGHTTEGGYGWPAYGGGAVAPTITALPVLAEKRLLWRQHFPVNMSARALRNLSGGVQTNTAGVVQIELCGTCVVGGPGMYWPDAPQWAIDEVARFGRWLISEGWAIPNVLPPRGFRRFEQLRGDGQRMTFAEWTSFTGICEHQNVPENDHGDGGGVMARVAAAMYGTTPPPPPPVQEDDMPTPTDLWSYFIPVGKDDKGNVVGTSAADLLAQANQQDHRQTASDQRTEAALSALSSAVELLGANAGVSVTKDEILAAVREGASQGLTVEGDVVLKPRQLVTEAAFMRALPPDVDKSAPSQQEDTPGHDGPVFED